MKINLTDFDVKTLKQDKNGLWTYRLKTRKGDVVGSEIKTKEEAILHAENNLTLIVKQILKK
jgi:hypothetical protein